MVCCFDLRDTRKEISIQYKPVFRLKFVKRLFRLGLITWFVNLARYCDPLFEQESLDMASDNRVRILRMTNETTVPCSASTAIATKNDVICHLARARFLLLTPCF